MFGHKPKYSAICWRDDGTTWKDREEHWYLFMAIYPSVIETFHHKWTPCLKKSLGISKGSRNDPLGNMNVCTMLFHGNPSKSCCILLWTKMVDRLSNWLTGWKLCIYCISLSIHQIPTAHPSASLQLAWLIIFWPKSLANIILASTQSTMASQHSGHASASSCTILLLCDWPRMYLWAHREETFMTTKQRLCC